MFTVGPEERQLGVSYWWLNIICYSCGSYNHDGNSGDGRQRLRPFASRVLTEAVE
jgi:hypothetical protein